MAEGKRLRALIIEDAVDDADLLLRELRRNGYQVISQRIDTAEAMRESLVDYEWDVILSDYSMPHFSAPAALKLLQDLNIDLPFIIISGTVGEDTAVASLKAGAHDFFAKNKLTRLVPAIERETREAEERRKRRQIEEELRQSEQRFAKAFHASPVAITITNMQGIYLDVNDYFLHLTGYRRIDVMGRTSMDVGTWVSADERTTMVDLLKTNGTVRNFETQVRTRAGELRDGLASLEMIELEGEPCILALFHDTTEQKRAQNELRALYNATTYLFEANDVATMARQIVQAVVQEFGQLECSLMMVNREHNLMKRLANAGNYKRADQPLYLNGTGLVVEAVRQECVIYVADVVTDARYLPSNPQTRSELVIPLRGSSGVIGVLDLQSTEANAFPEGDRRIMTAFAERAANAIEAAQLYERLNAYAAEMERRVEDRTAELQQAKERLEIILDNSSDAIMLVDTDGVIQQVNDSFSPQFGIPRDAAAGVSLSTLFVSEFLPVLTQTLTSVAETGKPTRIDLIACRRDGLRFDVEVSLAPVRETNGSRSGLICSVHDITSRKQAEQELRMALEKEKEVNELKSRFVSMVSHEFRTPLSTILSSSEAVKMYKDRMPEEKQLQHLDRIYSQVKRMVALLDDILVLSRAEAKGMAFVPTMTPLKAFCQDVVEDMQFIAQDHKIEFTYDGEQQSVPIDRELLRQILTNLFSNAVKYSPAGRRIWFDVVCSNSQALFRVRDEGIGIPEEDLPRMFEAFHRARNAGQVQGTGLGLAIVKRAVDAHGGKITFVSQVNKGTTFTLTLPLIPPEDYENGSISILEILPEDED